MSEQVPDALTAPLAGGRLATVTPSDKGWPDRVAIHIEGGGMPPFLEASWAWGSSRARTALANLASLSPGDLDALAAQIMPWTQALTEQQAAAKEAAKTAPVRAADWQVSVLMRGVREPASSGTQYPPMGLTELIRLFQQPQTAEDRLVVWSKDDLKHFACVDLDFHASGTPRPTRTEIEDLARALAPAPAAWWRTQGGGLHALYGRIAPYNADELAACAAAQLLTSPVVVRCGGSVEIKADSRHPGGLQKGKRCGPVHPEAPDTHLLALAIFDRAEADEDAITAFCEEQGVTIGQRLDHGFCPIDPTHASNSPNPVVLTATGVYCHSCAGRLGSGFRSWGAVMRSCGHDHDTAPQNAPLLEAVRSRAQWPHAEYLLDSYASWLPKAFRKLLYQALLKQAHGENLLVDATTREFHFVRGESEWLHADTLLHVNRPLNARDVSPLSAVHELGLDDEGLPKLQEVPGRISIFTNNGRLPGWFPIIPIPFASPIGTQHNLPRGADPNAGCYVRPRRTYNSKPSVSYLKPEDRIPMAEAEARIAAYFPGLSIPYLKSLIIAGGCGEAAGGMVPMLWATGMSSAAKTTTVLICAEMYGEELISLTKAREDRLDQLFGEALEKTRWIMFDDFAKEPDEYARLHAFLIRIGRSHQYHHLHVGQRVLPVRSSIILTDWRTPPFFTQDVQFARRVHLLRLEGTVTRSWQAMGRLAEGWWLTSPELRKAAESFHSHLVDQFFPEGDGETFDNKMATLHGHDTRIVGQEQGSETEEAMREMVLQLATEIVCAPDSEEPLQRRIGRGFKRVAIDGTDPLSGALTAIAEMLGSNYRDLQGVRQLLDPWQIKGAEVFGCMPFAFELREHGRNVYIRMAETTGLGRDRTVNRKVNRELFSTWPLTIRRTPPAAQAEGAA